MEKISPKYDTSLFVSLSRSIAFNWLLTLRVVSGYQCCSCQGTAIVNHSAHSECVSGSCWKHLLETWYWMWLNLPSALRAMDHAAASWHPARADQHPASVQFKSHPPPLRIPVGLKQCIRLMFYLHAAMKFLYQLGRCDESFVSWVPETLLGYVLAQCLYLSQRKHPRAWMSFTRVDGMVKLRLCLICIVCHLQNTLIHQSGPGLRSWTKLQPHRNSQCLGVCQPLIWVNLGALLGSAAAGVCFVLFGSWKWVQPFCVCLLASLIPRNRAEVLLTILYRYTG